MPGKPQGLLSPNVIPTWLWQYISCDLITHLPDLHGYTAILVVIDRLSLMYDKVTSEGIAWIFFDWVWWDFGVHAWNQNEHLYHIPPTNQWSD